MRRERDFDRGTASTKTVNSDMLGDMHDYEYVLLAADSNVDYKY